ncbi:MAG: class I SAM-dependent methyltransferase [SAR202 cluster bacterium]|jgi:SAM-dependent methyltransferase|nr:class I SAM-dependent methyltransferase [SAR202 cluster bacterium]MDP6514462.1 class I SAM-dependent methyltransferase [SAR202 cluster bacterium]MDP6714511.1 class I SAM-dependent methyltransferase [SAR202 cluster bacterium]
MTTDQRDFWNEVWSESVDAHPEPDQLLIEKTQNLKPGKALDIGCGVGGNVVWLASQGWNATGIDFSDAAIKHGRSLAAKMGVEAEFLLADAANDKIHGEYDLITMFYLHLPSDDRARMLAEASKSLAAGGTLLFVGHDESGATPESSEDRVARWTNPQEVAAEIQGLVIEEATVLDENTGGSHGSHMQGGHLHNRATEHDEHQHQAGHTRTTLVRAVKQ